MRTFVKDKEVIVDASSYDTMLDLQDTLTELRVGTLDVCESLPQKKK